MVTRSTVNLSMLRLRTGAAMLQYVSGLTVDRRSLHKRGVSATVARRKDAGHPVTMAFLRSLLVEHGGIKLGASRNDAVLVLAIVMDKRMLVMTDQCVVILGAPVAPTMEHAL